MDERNHQHDKIDRSLGQADVDRTSTRPTPWQNKGEILGHGDGTPRDPRQLRILDRPNRSLFAAEVDRRQISRLPRLSFVLDLSHKPVHLVPISRIDEIDQVEALELDMAWTQELPEGLRDPGEDHVEVEIGDHDVRAGRRLGGRPCRGE